MAKKIKKNHLPEDVIEKIFSFLPFKKLCTLSVLSKRFRNSWKLCRDLSFDIEVARNLSRDEYRNIVENFFSNHSSTRADRLKLCYDATDEGSLVSFWVGKAIKLGIEELELNLTQKEDEITLEHDLIDGESLRILRLINCELKLPPESNGLRHLRELTLQSVAATEKLTASVFRNCVSLRVLRLIRCRLVYAVRAVAAELEVLVVKDCFDVHLVEIDSPSLGIFHYHGKMAELRFRRHAPRLSDVILEIAHPRGFHRLSKREEIVARFSFVEILTVTSVFLEVNFQDFILFYKSCNFLIFFTC